MKPAKQPTTIKFSEWVFADQFIQDLKDAKVEDVDFDLLLSSVLVNGNKIARTLTTTCDWLKSGYVGDLMAYTHRLDFLKHKKYGDPRYQDQGTLIPNGRIANEQFGESVKLENTMSHNNELLQRMPAEQFDNILRDQLAINRI